MWMIKNVFLTKHKARVDWVKSHIDDVIKHYRLESGNLQVTYMFITNEQLNPGDLYGNNRLENLGTDNMLEVRNNTIIRLLEETTDIVENRHTGIATMRDEMNKMNLPEPEFETLRGTFKVTFRKEKVESNEQNKTEMN